MTTQSSIEKLDAIASLRAEARHGPRHDLGGGVRAAQASRRLVISSGVASVGMARQHSRIFGSAILHRMSY